MSSRTLDIRHIRLISLHWTKYAVRSGSGLVFLMIALIFGLSVAQMIITPVEMVIRQQAREGSEADREQIVNLINEIGQPIIQWAIGQKTFEEINSPEASPVSGMPRWDRRPGALPLAALSKEPFYASALPRQKLSYHPPISLQMYHNKERKRPYSRRWLNRGRSVKTADASQRQA